jgi:hypothetical protein
MRRRGWASFAGAGAFAVLTAGAGAAAASSGIDSPDSGVEQSGRGSAWLARADDPVAVFFNPAAIAFQATSVHVGTQLLFQNRCFTREGANGQPVAPVSTISPPGTAPASGVGVPPPAEVCSAGGAFPNPQLGAVFRITNDFALGLALVAPHAAGNNSWPEALPYVNKFLFPAFQPSPQRYLLTGGNSLIIYPTLSIAYAPLENLSFGAGFVWGIATVDFTNFTQGIATMPTAMNTSDNASGDVKAELQGKDLFVPGVVVSALWSPARMLDVSAWYHWQDAIKFQGDLALTSLYFTSSGARNTTPCTGLQGPLCNVTVAPGAGAFEFQIPMEAKLGFRLHLPRKEPDRVPGWASAPGRKVRDPLSQDIFDLEVDFTWAHNSEMQNIDLSFPSSPSIKFNGGGGAVVPSNADIPHDWKDVLGVRVGGDVVVVPNVLTLRTGGFFESAGQSAQYLNVDFDLAQKIGVSGGATLRLGVVDLSVAYAHTFYGTLDNGGKGSIYALAGSGSAAGCTGGPTTQNVGPGCYRSFQSVNGGSLRESLNEMGLSGTVHF